MPRRRSVLALLGSTALAGCASLLEEEPSTHKPTLEVFVANGTDRPLTVTVRAVRGSTTLFVHTYSLAPGHGDESESFVGRPTEIRVSVRDGRNVERAYSIPASCDAPEVNVDVQPDEITVTNGCVQ